MYRKYEGATGYGTGRLSRKRLMMINPNGCWFFSRAYLPMTATADRDSGVVVRTLERVARAVSEVELLHGTATVAMHLLGGPELGNSTSPAGWVVAVQYLRAASADQLDPGPLGTPFC
jgi:hypothetical protein